MKFRKVRLEDSQNTGDEEAGIMIGNQSAPFYKQAWFIPMTILLTILLWLQLSPTS